MNQLQEIIERIRKDLSCPICGESYEKSKITAKDLFHHAYIIQTICRHGHISIFITGLKNEKTKSKSVVTQKELTNFHQFLNNFNGDFETVWKNQSS